MSYSRPNGSYANFDAPGYTPPSGSSLEAWFPPLADFEFSGVEFSAPDGDAANFTLAEVVSDVIAQFPPDEYTRPDGDAANFQFPPSGEPEAVIDFAIDVTFDVAAEHDSEVPEAVADFTVGVSADAQAAHGVSGTAAFSIDISVDADADHGVSGTASFSIDVSASAAAVHERYEVKGQVRDAGVLVNRTVRVYRRDNGALVGEQMTTLGRFRIHTGFAQREHYILPVDLDDAATDWSPPAANRVLSVLAED